MRIAALIPARIGSTRLPHKLLLPLGEVPVIVQTYRQVIRSIADEVWVVAEDETICKVMAQHGGNCLHLKGDFRNGTERCLAAFVQFTNQGKQWDGLINVQGDEPLISPHLIDDIIQYMKHSEVIVTAACVASGTEVTDPDTVKVVFGQSRQVLYFSRASIPHGARQYWKHIGIYGFPRQLISTIQCLPPSSLEDSENLEQLRWLDHGLPIHVITTSHTSHAIDTIEDYHRVLRLIETHESRCA